MSEADQQDFAAIAIVGMALRVPGAVTLAQFWHNLEHGVESTTFFDDAALRAAGVPAATLADPAYVKACGRLECADQFDAAFFDLTPREAEILDPQHRQLLECSWEALEHAGYAPGSEAMAVTAGQGRVGVFAGVGLNGYLLHQLASRADLIESLGGWQITLGNDKDFAATRVAYKLDLCGPALNVSTACSTSLVGVGMGCQSLLSYQCDMVLAGGCTIHLPQDQGYWHHQGGTLSPDGRCRAFDVLAQGTLDASGVAMLVLKRLEDAQRDGDTVHAVIRGFAINNDGAQKVGYTAPSVGGQEAVIREAQEMAAVDAATIGYVETHGTGTDLGDLIEVAALTEAFRHAGRGGETRVGWCGIGSLKSNFGHLDTAAGAASLIKTVLGLQRRQIPPSLHFSAPNPKLELASSPFYVNATVRDWPRLKGAPRRAGVSSFGIGGTNAHVVVEEAPPAPAVAEGRAWQVLPLSARGAAALEQGARCLAEHLGAEPQQSLADVAATLQLGRQAFRRRLAVVARDGADAAKLLAGARAGRVFTGVRGEHAPGVVFMFPGQDAQFPGMAQALYRDEPLFRAQVDACAAILQERHGVDLLARLFSPGGEADPAYATDPLPLFVLEYGLAQVWLALGLRPQALLGYSLGEYACACLAGVMSLEDALALAVAGARLLALVQPGALLAVSLTEAELRPLLGPDLEIAMLMAPRQCVVGGSADAVAALERRLAAQGAACLPSPLGLPFHTAHMEPFLAPYRAELRKVRLHAPRIPYVSCVSGDWISAAEATDPEHYLHLARRAVHLAQGLERLFALPDTVLLEVGPSQTISSLVFLQARRPAELVALSTLCDPRYQSAEAAQAALPTALARLWTAGVDIKWGALYANEARRRVPLPSYAFEHRRYWVEAAPQQQAAAPATSGKLAAIAQWFHLPVWRELPPVEAMAAPGEWLLVGGGVTAEALAARLRAAGGKVDLAALDVTDTAAWDALLDELIAGGHRPEHIVYLGLLDCAADDAALLSRGFHALIALGQSIGRRWFAEALRLTVVAERLFALGDAVPAPAAAAVLGPLRVLPQEYPNLRCRAVDLLWPDPPWARERLLDQLAAELAGGSDTALALRSGRRWSEEFVPYPLAAKTSPALRPGGVYLITGGLGHIGLALAERIAQRAPGARLLLTGRSGQPAQPGAATDALQRERQRAVQQLAALGAEVRVVAADVTDAAAMAALIAAAERDWGPLNGVIHAAGLVGQASFATVAESTRAFCAAQLAPKLQGARVLEAVLGERRLDFCLLCSSLSPILGGLGFAAYAAANAALDACAAAHNLTHPTRWLTVNWEGWRFDDEAAASAQGAGAAVAELGLTAAEGADAFERILAAPGLERIVLSTADLGQRIRQWVTLDAPPAPAETMRHARPALLGAYVAPAGEVARTVCGLWEQLLGIDGIGAEDSFFELGGNSLLLTQLLAQIRKRFRLELSLASLFERPTIAAIAGLIEARQRAAAEADSEREEGEL